MSFWQFLDKNLSEDKLLHPMLIFCVYMPIATGAMFALVMLFKD